MATAITDRTCEQCVESGREVLWSIWHRAWLCLRCYLVFKPYATWDVRPEQLTPEQIERAYLAMDDRNEQT